MNGPFFMHGQVNLRKYYGNSETRWSCIASSRPSRGIITSDRSGIFQLYAWSVESGAVRQLTTGRPGVTTGQVSADGRYVFHLDDPQVGKDSGIVRLRWDDCITDAERQYVRVSASAVGYATDSSGSQVYWIEPQASQFSLRKAVLDQQGRHAIHEDLYQSPGPLFGPVLSPDDRFLAVSGVDNDTNLSFIRVFNCATGVEYQSHIELGSRRFEVASLMPVNNSLFVLASNDNSGYVRPFIWNVDSGRLMSLRVPHIAGDWRPVQWSSNLQHILLRRVLRAQSHLAVFDLRSGNLSVLDRLPGSIGRAYFGPSGNVFAHWHDSTHPMRVERIGKWGRGAVEPVIGSRRHFKARKPDLVVIPCTDSSDLHAWLTVPSTSGRHPLIIDIPEGPGGVITERFSPDRLVWSESGVASLIVNCHGSSSFGGEYQYGIQGRPGILEVQDAVRVTNWAIERGIARSDQIILRGFSYGGFVSLLAAGVFPEIWKAVIAVAPAVDWLRQYELTSALVRCHIEGIFGGPPSVLPEIYRQSSPSQYAGRVQSPMLIIYGQHDKTCPAVLTEDYAQLLSNYGCHVTLRRLDCGHAELFNRVACARSIQAWSMHFLNSVLD